MYYNGTHILNASRSTFRTCPSFHTSTLFFVALISDFYYFFSSFHTFRSAILDVAKLPKSMTSCFYEPTFLSRSCIYYQLIQYTWLISNQIMTLAILLHDLDLYAEIHLVGAGF